MYFLQILLNGIVISSQIALLAFSFYLVYSVSRVPHIALGAIGVFVAYSLLFVFVEDMNIVFMVIIPLLSAIFMGLVSYGLLEPFIRKHQDALALIVSFGFLIVLESVVAIMFGSGSRFFSDGNVPVLRYGELKITVAGLSMIIFAFMTFCVAYIVIFKTYWGRIIRGIAENLYSAISISVNAPLVRLSIFIIASIIVGITMIIHSYNTSLYPSNSFFLTTIAFIAFFVGGVERFKGVFLASFVIVLVPELFIGLVPAEWGVSFNWKIVVMFLFALLLLIIRPKGLLYYQERI